MGEIPSTPPPLADSPTELFSEEEQEDGLMDSESYPLGTYILSVVGRTKRRTLHQVGGCYRVPGLHYKEFVVTTLQKRWRQGHRLR